MYFLGVTACLHHRHHGCFGKWTFRTRSFGSGLFGLGRFGLRDQYTAGSECVLGETFVAVPDPGVR